MQFANITFRQMPILIAIAAIIVVLFALANNWANPKAIKQAIQSKSMTRLAEAVAKYPDQVNRPDARNGLVPLHWAAMGNQAHMVEYLLDHGAKVNAGDRYGLTPLHAAAAFDAQATADMLLNHGAELNALGTKYGVMQLMPLHLAAEAGFTGVIRVLLDHGANVNARTGGQNHVTPLHMAAAKGRAPTVKMLLQNGAEVNARDDHGKTPLHWALVAEQSDCAEIIRIFGGME